INYHYLKGQPDLAIEYGARCLPNAERPDAPGVDRTARQYLATSYHAMGRFSGAEEMLQRTAAELEDAEEYTAAGPANLLYVSACGWRAFSLTELGEFEAAHASAAKAVRAANASGFAYSQAIANTISGLVWSNQGHLDRAVPLLETAIRLCRE